MELSISPLILATDPAKATAGPVSAQT